MRRCVFVEPETIRITLAEEAQRDYDEARARHDPSVSDEELAALDARIAVEREAGDWIEVKKFLNLGETREIFAALAEMSVGEKTRLDARKVGLTKALQYITEWSFRDAQGKPARVSFATLTALDTEIGAAVLRAVDRHEVAMQAERTARKNVLAGSPA